MSSVVKAVVGVIAIAAAVFVPGLGTVLAASLLIGGGALVVSSVLAPMNAKKNSSTNTALQQTLNPDEYRKIVFGKAPAGNDIRYWEVYGSAGYDQIIVAATHKINSFQSLWIEGNACSISSGNVTETIVSSTGTTTKSGFLNVLYNTMGVTATNLAAGQGTLWNSSCSLTGLAYYRLKWTYDQKKMPNGFPNRIVQVVEGALVYDPRRDSTVGGSGSHRANDQTTWDYATTDSNGVPLGLNNALQMLWYLIGWRIQNPQTNEWILVAGRGVNLNDIDYASFILAANQCEAAQYYTDMVLSTGDTHSTNENIISSGSQGVLVDTGGLWSYYPAVDDTASIAVAFTDDDIISGVVWTPKASITSQYNEVNGTFIDPSQTVLYQSAPYPSVKSATYLSQDNNFPARMNLDFQCVQSAALAQKLAWIALNKSRLSGVFKATFNLRAFQAKNYNCCTLSFAPLGFVNKLFRITKQSINPAGGIDLELTEESAAVYSSGTINSYTAPSQGLSYDPAQLINVGTVTATSTFINGSGSTVVDALDVIWPAAAANVRAFEVYYCLHGATVYIPWGTIAADKNEVIIAPLQPSTSYDVLVRTISVNGVVGNFSSVTQSTGNHNTIPLASVAGAGTVAGITPPSYAGMSAALSALGVGQLFSDTTDSNKVKSTTGSVLVPKVVNGVGTGSISNVSANTSCFINFTGITTGGFWNFNAQLSTRSATTPYTTLTSAAGTWQIIETQTGGGGSTNIIASGTWSSGPYSAGAPGINFAPDTIYSNMLQMSGGPLANINTGNVTLTLALQITSGTGSLAAITNGILMTATFTPTQ